jgi:hypothetical protein
MLQMCERPDIARMIPSSFANADATKCRSAAEHGDFSDFTELPPDLGLHLANCSDCCLDVCWFVEIRQEISVEQYPCVHIAYASTAHANHMIHQSNNVFVLTTNRKRAEGIVIGYCPWCGLALNTSACGR